MSLEDALDSYARSTDVLVRELKDRTRELESLAMFLSLGDTGVSEMKRFDQALTRSEARVYELTAAADRETKSLHAAEKLIEKFSASLSRLESIEKLSRNRVPVVRPEEESKPVVALPVPKPAAPRSDAPGCALPTREQFEQIPRYMRGVTVYEDLQVVCEAINAAWLRKVSVLDAPQERLGPKARAALARWHRESESEHECFVSELDVGEELPMGFLSDKTKSCVECLRHVGSLRVRGSLYVLM